MEEVIKEKYKIYNFKGERIAMGEIPRPDLNSKNTWFGDKNDK